MNGAPLPPQHGAPLRLVVPRWYGMASVKWLRRHRGDRPSLRRLSASGGLSLSRRAGGKGEPCSLMRVNSLMAPPGSWILHAPADRERRRNSNERAAWSGVAPVERVEFGVDGKWTDAVVAKPQAPHAWQSWQGVWHAKAGEHELGCRATDAAGRVQPLEPVWDLSGLVITRCRGSLSRAR